MKISIVIITNNKRPNILDICIKTAMNNSDEVIVVGNIENLDYDVTLIDAKELANSGNISKMRNIGANIASGDYIINCDDDIIFPPNYKKKILKYIDLTKHKVFTTRVLSQDGYRYWDRPVQKHNKSYMIDYDAYDKDLYYSGGLIIRHKSIVEKYQWDESLGFYEKEDVIYSKLLKQNGYDVNIDKYSYVIHYDDSYITYMGCDGYLVCDKLSDKTLQQHIIIDKDIVKTKREILALLKMWKIKL